MSKIYGNTVGSSYSGWSDEAKKILITILRSSAPDGQLENVNTLEQLLLGTIASDTEAVSILGTGVLGKIILGRSA